MANFTKIMLFELSEATTPLVIAYTLYPLNTVKRFTELQKIRRLKDRFIVAVASEIILVK
jgi:hypothetical protein